MMDNVKIYASNYASGKADDPSAVIVSAGMNIIIRLTIADAREVSNQLAIAADEAEAKLKD